ncbi:MAG: hypothetical protein RJA99_4194 [Pseudomonadota bacterium]|jgi:G3E family GTPase
MTRPTETLLITGFLGAGKTTLLSGWLAERPPHERWAVLVNEFGALGVDRALLGGDGADAAVAVAEIAGGCACCAARVAFDATLVRLLRRGPWDRLFVETTGLGHPAQLLDRLRAPALADRLRVRPPVAVVDASRATVHLDPARPAHAIAADQVALARLLVLNRAAEGPAADTAALSERLAALPPWPRPVLATADGRVPLARVLAALDAIEEPDAAVAAAAGGPAAPSAPTAAPTAARTPTTRPASNAPPAPDEASTPAARAVAPPEPLRWRRTDPASGIASAGWWWPADACFDRGALRAALDALGAPGGPLDAGGALRAKGVFRTPRAWYAWQWTEGCCAWDETAWRADSRFEFLANGSIDPQMVDTALRTAVSKG